MNIGIATAHMRALSKYPFYFGVRGYYAWSIMFYNTSTFKFHNLPFVKVGDTRQEAEATCQKFKNNFKQAQIFDEEKIAIIFNLDNGDVIAIGKIGANSWIDVRNHFSNKDFNELNIKIDCLTVY